MAYIIVCAHTLVKKRQQPVVTHGSLNATSYSSYSHNQYIENIDVASKHN